MTDEIDERRARVIADYTCTIWQNDTSISSVCELGQDCMCLRQARAIRESDEAAGYIVARLEGIVNDRDRRRD